MRTRINSTSVVGRSVSSFVSIVKNIEASELRKTDKKQEESTPSWNWRKIIRTMRDAGSVISFIVSLLKILQELGLF